jgi:hypothetical protein
MSEYVQIPLTQFYQEFDININMVQAEKEHFQQYLRNSPTNEIEEKIKELTQTLLFKIESILVNFQRLRGYLHLPHLQKEVN